jgi:predicted DNA-binding WGR domain protein
MISLSKFFELRVHETLDHYIRVDPTSLNLIFFKLYHFLEPTIYEPEIVIEFLENMFHPCACSFYYDISRNMRRFGNQFQRGKINIRHYGRSGGQGKCMIPSLRAHIGLKALEEEQTKRLLESKLQSNFDELQTMKRYQQMISRSWIMKRWLGMQRL